MGRSLLLKKNQKAMGRSPQQLEDVAELIQDIQSRLPVKEAARTSILSKSWLHAWSTIPTLRFHVPNDQEIKQLKLVYIDRTLTRYLNDNIPIESFDLNIKTENVESASLAKKWIRSVATKTCLKELFLTIGFCGASFRLSNAIFSGENLTKLRVSPDREMRIICGPPLVNCVSLRELYLSRVRIEQQLLDHILSSCRLLVKIELECCFRSLKTIKVKSLPCLEELQVLSKDFRRCPYVEINNVPNLRLVSCYLQSLIRTVPSKARLIASGNNVTQLSLGGRGLVTDDASLDIIKSGFPFLESLSLDMACWRSRSFHFTCASPIKRISLVMCPQWIIDIKINARELLFFSLKGTTMPSLSFPISTTLNEIIFVLDCIKTFDASFFLKMREALELSSKCYVHIGTTCVGLHMDLDDLKTRLMFPPATNVQTLSFFTSNEDECMSPFFDAFFEICHPKLVISALMLREVLEKKTNTTASWHHYLKHVQTTTPRHKSSFLREPSPLSDTNFQLKWSYS